MITHNSIRLAVKAKVWMPTQKEWIFAAQCIQPEEKERIERFVFKKDAKSAMVGRLLIRRVVALMLGISYRCVRLGRTDKGKPYVLKTPGEKTPQAGCNFNISHQGDYVVIAAEEDKQVGVDIMKVEWPRSTGVQEFFRLMERQLTEAEWACVRRQPGDMEQLTVFYRCWCLKESLVKALGSGIGFEVSRLNFDMGATRLSTKEVIRSTKVEVDGTPDPDWTFEETMLEDHCVAVATRPEQFQRTDSPKLNGSQSDLCFTVWSVEELLGGCEPLQGSEPDPRYWDNFAAKKEAPDSGPAC